eukprot:137685_1
MELRIRSPLKAYSITMLILIVLIYYVIINISPINVLPSVEVSITNDSHPLEYLPIFDNKASLIRSCSISSYYDLLKPSYRQPYVTTTLCYTHVHKCGGTTIMNLFKYLYSNHYIKHLYHPKDFYEWMFDLKDHKQQIILFSYVRDPIHRNDLMEMRSVLSSMLQSKEKKEFPWHLNKHLWPQMLFLIDKYGTLLDFNYIGLLDHINMTLPWILERYEHVSSDIVQNYLRDHMHKNSRSRAHDELYASYDDYVSTNDLSQHDKQMIEQVYYLDYQCLFPS